MTGLGALLRLALRRDRIGLPIWVYALVGSVIGTAASFRALYPDPAQLRTFAMTLAANPGLRVLYGPLHSGSLGGVTTWRVGTTGSALVALMSLLTVVRHSRAEEESGRLELLGATAINRHAPLAAAWVLSLAANVVIAVATALGLIGFGLPVAGSCAYGVASLVAGSVFTGIAAITAQLTASARAANGLAAAALGVSFLVRAIGDSAGAGVAWLSWLSPIGWAQQVQPFAADRWWVGVGSLVIAAGLIGVGHLLVSRRDVGAGVWATRIGPGHAAASLSGPFGLAWRLQRGALLGWACGFLVIGGVLGGAAESIATIVRSSAQLQDLIARQASARGFVDAYLSSTMNILALIASVFAVQSVLRLRAEETSLRAEPVLAGAVGRRTWALSHAVVAGAGSGVVLGLAGAGAGMVHGIQTHDLGRQVARLMAAGLVQVPAVWVVAGIAAALVGLAPRWASLSWVAVVGCLLIGQFGPLLRLSQWALDLSPFTHTPLLPGGPLSSTPLVWLTVSALVLAGAGLVGVGRRDVG